MIPAQPIALLRRLENRATVPVATAHHVDQGDLAHLGGSLGLLVVARKEKPHVSTGVGCAIDPVGGDGEPELSAAIGACNDQEIGIEPVALEAGVADLLGELVRRDLVHLVRVVVGALRIDLVLDVGAGDAGLDHLAHRPHGVQRLTEARACIDDHRDFYDARGVGRDGDLLSHREERLAHSAGRARDVAAAVDGLEARLLDEPRTEPVPDRGHVQKGTGIEQGFQSRRFSLDHGQPTVGGVG